MTREHALSQAEKLNILSVNRLADILKVSVEKLRSLSSSPNSRYSPFPHVKPARPFQRKPPCRSRQIDNPLRDLSWVQKRINQRLLVSICFPENIFGGIRKRSILDNAEHHHGASLLVTIDVKKCFPSVTNRHVYAVWKELLGGSPPVAAVLTRLTTFERHLPQGAATSPLLANLFIWMIDQPIREACQELGLAYSTWIDDLAFSGDLARDAIQIAARTLASYGLRISRDKVKIMGPRSEKVITGTRLGTKGIRAPREKLYRIRSGIHHFEVGHINDNRAERYLKGLVAQLRFVRQLCPKDAQRYAAKLRTIAAGTFLSTADTQFLIKASQ